MEIVYFQAAQLLLSLAYPTQWHVRAQGLHRAISGLFWATVCCLHGEDPGSWAASGTVCAHLSPVIAGCVPYCSMLPGHWSCSQPAGARPQGRDSPAAAAGFPPHLLQVDEDISYGRGLSSCHFGSGPKGLDKISTLLFHRQAPSKPGEWHNLWREGRTRECRGRLLAAALKPLAPDPEVTSPALGEPPQHH